VCLASSPAAAVYSAAALAGHRLTLPMRSTQLVSNAADQALPVPLHVLLEHPPLGACARDLGDAGPLVRDPCDALQGAANTDAEEEEEEAAESPCSACELLLLLWPGAAAAAAAPSVAV